jgi:hypothetical protein
MDLSELPEGFSASGGGQAGQAAAQKAQQVSSWVNILACCCSHSINLIMLNNVLYCYDQ